MMKRSRVGNDGLTNRERRRMARNYMHKVAIGRSCNRAPFRWRVPCWPCLWQDLTGANRRKRAAELAKMRKMRDVLPSSHRRTKDGLEVLPYPRRLVVPAGYQCPTCGEPIEVVVNDGETGGVGTGVLELDLEPCGHRTPIAALVA